MAGMAGTPPSSNLISKEGAEAMVRDAFRAIDSGAGAWDRGPAQQALRTLYEAGQKAKALMDRDALEQAIRDRERHIAKEQNVLAGDKKKLEQFDE